MMEGYTKWVQRLKNLFKANGLKFPESEDDYFIDLFVDGYTIEGAFREATRK